MEKKQNLFLFGIVAIVLITLLGFFKPYFSKIPSFENIHIITHFHLIAFSSWFVLLIWQPILIRQKKFEIHKKVGLFSYFLVPFLVATILLMIQDQLSYYNPNSSNESVYINMLGGSLSGLFFTIYYIIAMVKQKNIRWHVAFIIASSLVLLNPGLSRLVAVLTDKQTGILAMIVTPFIVLITIIIYEKLKSKRSIFKSPFALIFLLFLSELLLFAWISGSKFWPTFIDSLARSYY